MLTLRMIHSAMTLEFINEPDSCALSRIPALMRFVWAKSISRVVVRPGACFLPLGSSSRYPFLPQTFVLLEKRRNMCKVLWIILAFILPVSLFVVYHNWLETCKIRKSNFWNTNKLWKFFGSRKNINSLGHLTFERIILFDKRIDFFFVLHRGETSRR